MTLLYGELSGQIKQCFYDAHNHVGLGFPEEAYHRALWEAFRSRGIRALSKPTLTVQFRGVSLLDLQPDFIVDERVIIEIKAIRQDFARDHFVQIFSYAKTSRLRLGFLADFGGTRVSEKRMLFDEKPLRISEQWDSPSLGAQSAVEGIKQAIQLVAMEAGLGYGEPVYKAMLCVALTESGFSLDASPVTERYYRGMPIGSFATNCILIDKRIVCILVAMKDVLDDFEVARLRCYVSAFHAGYGIAVNFGKSLLEIRGIGP